MGAAEEEWDKRIKLYETAFRSANGAAQPGVKRSPRKTQQTEKGWRTPKVLMLLNVKG